LEGVKDGDFVDKGTFVGARVGDVVDGIADGTDVDLMVGLMDGSTVGPNVREAEGIFEGPTVGDWEGADVGDRDGRNDGFCDGLEVGKAVEMAVGFEDVGSNVREAEGIADGPTVGDWEGADVGDRDGRNDGFCDGLEVGKAVEMEMVVGFGDGKTVKLGRCDDVVGR